MAPVKSVAVVGAGISGISSAAHLLRHGIEVVVFERSAVAGGVWHFDPRTDKDPPYPIVHSAPGSPATEEEGNGYPKKPITTQNGNGSVHHVGGSSTTSDTTTTTTITAEDIALAHAPPGPCYEGLMNNVPTTMMRSTLLQWPAGTPEHISHTAIETYVQTLARTTGVEGVTRYDTRVEEVVKIPATGRWRVRTRTLVKQQQQQQQQQAFEDREWEFDAVVVAAGHYHVPLIPGVPGLAEWKDRFPARVMHSKSYRQPATFRDQNVLLIGAGVSSLDIAKELDGVARKTYQSSRGGKFDLDPSLLPANAERVGGIASFRLDEGKAFGLHEADSDSDSDSDSDAAAAAAAALLPIPGTVHLADGRILGDIHRVVVASGYQTTYPFLTGLESEAVTDEAADARVIITADKCVTHNLHKDMFYIPDPTLSFVGVPYYTSTFSMFDFQAEVVARVYAGLSHLPSRETMAAEYAARKAKGDKGKAFHSLIQHQVPYMEEILAWANAGAEARGVARMQGVDAQWYAGYETFKAMSRRLIPQDSTQLEQPLASKYYAAGPGSSEDGSKT